MEFTVKELHKLRSAQVKIQEALQLISEVRDSNEDYGQSFTDYSISTELDGVKRDIERVIGVNL